MSTPRHRHVIVIVAAMLLVVGAIMLGVSTDSRRRLRESEESSRVMPLEQLAVDSETLADDPALAKYVGSTECAQCHADIAAKYARHPMGRSAALMTDAAALEAEGPRAAFVAAPGLKYSVERRDDGVWHHERLTDPNGELLYDQAVPVHIAIGSGRRGQTYLINHEGLLFVSPISWYSQKQRWDLSPRYVAGQHPRFERRVLDGCLACHVGLTRPEPGVPNRFRAMPVVESAIGCERCHGPGRDHVAHRSGHLDIADVIVNPARLEPRARESVCHQCHLQGEQRVLQAGRRPQDFRPGELLDDTWAVFVRGTATDGQQTDAVSQVEQMHSSRCFRSSDGRMGCVSCHDPHSLPENDERDSFFRQRCLTCHQEQSCSAPLTERQAPAIADSCIRCHMPKLKAEDIPHTTQTDHRVLRNPSATPKKKTLARIELFDGMEQRLTPAAVDRAWGLFWAKDDERKSVSNHSAEALRRLEAARAAGLADVDLLESYAGLLTQRGDTAQAIPLWEQVRRLSPRRESADRQLAIIARRSGRLSEAKQLASRSLLLNPWQAHAHGEFAELLWQLGEREAALVSAQRAIDLNPSLMPTRRWFVNALRELGREEDRQREESVARRLITSHAVIDAWIAQQPSRHTAPSQQAE